MGQNFDDYPGFQPKTTFMYYFAHNSVALGISMQFGIFADFSEYTA